MVLPKVIMASPPLSIRMRVTVVLETCPAASAGTEMDKTARIAKTTRFIFFSMFLRGGAKIVCGTSAGPAAPRLMLASDNMPEWRSSRVLCISVDLATHGQMEPAQNL
jgi:hypothetical protein